MILYGGSYTEEVGPGLSGTGNGIYCFYFNNENGELFLLNTFLNRNTSYIAISEDKKYLFSFQEVLADKKPVVLSFFINEDCSLKLISKQPIDGGLPCHLNIINNKTLGVACYQTGSVHLFPINEDGSLEPSSQTFKNVGASVNVERQECAHSHMVAINNNQIFVPDLGIDKIVVFNNEENLLKETYNVEMPLGAGPRHIVFHPKGEYGFVINELTSGVSIVKKENSKFKVVENVSSIPNTYRGVPAAAAIKMSPDGKFLYVSNRGSNTIAIFSFNFENGKLELVDQQYTEGETPRDFEISPTGEWLLVANQDSNTIIVFKRDLNSGKLKEVAKNSEVQSVVCLKFL
ncbi:6-phosphogluconolactonase [Lutibacter oricola]|uniref:6-phosphogluconolactonase n=1 Tax=Lutibacter oricola TaxID=762486 RepID=A0A1H3B376_9FLAO|nr:lactonase family protein [Lutibacter oricola]SDX36363.1 6-phosphogluconolactonase [Lutibacter oricola]